MLQTEQRIIQVYPLWQRGQLLLGCAPMTLDCNNNLLGTLRRAWLVPSDCEGGKDYNLVFAQPDPNIQNVMTGIWMQTSDGEGIVLNANSIEDIVSACDSCCGNSPLVPLEYSPATPILPPVQILPSTYSFTRTDNGSNYAKSIAEMDYYGQYIPGTFLWKSHVGTQTRYEFQSRKMPALIGTDVYSGGGTYYKKVSNEAPPKATDDLYSLMVYSTYFGNSGPWLGKTLADIVYQLQTIGGFTTDVAVSTEQNRIMALTIQNNLSFVLGVQSIEGTVILSNPAVPPASGNLYQLNIVAAGFNSRDSLFGQSLQGGGVPSVIDGKQIFPDWQQATLWVENGNQIAFSSPGVNTATLTLLTNINPIGRLFVSNIVDALLPGNAYQLTFKYIGDSGPQTDISIKGTTMADMAAQANITFPDNRIGTWTAQADTISVTTKVTNIYNIYLQIDQFAMPSILSSNRPATGRYALDIILDSVPKFPMVTAVGATSNLDLAAIPALDGLGAWSYPDPNVRLTGLGFTFGTLTLAGNGVIFSNPPPTLTAGQILQLRVFLATAFLDVDVVGATLAELIANIPSAYAPEYDAAVIGTWSIQTGQLRMDNPFMSTDRMYVVLQAMTSPVFLSNVAPAVPTDQHLSMTVKLGNNIIYPILSAGDVTFLRSRIASTAPFSGMGTWALNGGNKIELTTNKFNPMTLTLAASNVYITNPAPTLTAGQVYQLEVFWNTTFIVPNVRAATLAEIVANIPIWGDWATIGGTWAVSGTQITLTGSTQNGVWIRLIPTTNPAIVSNVAPAITAGEHLNFIISIINPAFYPYLGSATVAGMLGFLNSTVPYTSFGTWSIVGGDKIQLANTHYDAVTLAINSGVTFYSNVAPVLVAGQQYRLKLFHNTAFITPDVFGATISSVVLAIPTTGDWATIKGSGTWGIISNEVVLTNSGETEIYMLLEAVPTPFEADSNSAPALTPGDQYVFTATLDSVEVAPTITATTLDDLLSGILADANYIDKGSWSINIDKIHLISATVTTATLVITTETIPAFARMAKGSTGNRTADSKKIDNTAANKKKK